MHPLRHRVGASKDVSFHTSVFFGVEIHNSGGSGLAPSRIAAIRALKYPENISELRQVLGLLTQCRKWVNMYSTSSNSLSHLLKNGVEWQFGEEQRRDFDAFRRALFDSTLVLHCVPQPVHLCTYVHYTGLHVLVRAAAFS